MKRTCLLSLAATILALLTITLTGCGKMEFGMTENTGKQMTITAKNADKDAFLMTGQLELSDGEQVVISSNLEKGSIKVELVAVPEEQSIDHLPEIDNDAVITANVSRTDVAAGTVPAGSYLLRATCLEKATGTVQIEVKPAG